MAKRFKKSVPIPKPADDKPEKTEYKLYQSFRLQKRIKTESGKLIGGFRLFGQAFLTLKHHTKLFSGIIIIYGLLYLVLVQGITALNGLDDAKVTLEESLSGNLEGLTIGLALFAQLITNTATLSTTANTYQFLITIMASLALIWTMRHVIAGNIPRIRDGFYHGMTPLVPFVLVLLVVVLELLPAAIGGTILGMVVNNGFAATGIEISLWATGFFVLAVVSLYLITSSVFALYIVTLPEMTPLEALRSARQLVRGRRWLVMRKVLFLPLALLISAAIILIPIIMFALPIAGWVFFLYMMIALALVHGYMFKLYRALI